MPNSCNSITKNLCIALLVSSCASTQNYQAGISLNGKFLANNGSNTFPFNVSLQSNTDVDIIQIKKPFYGNVLIAEIDRKSSKILSLDTNYDMQEYEIDNFKDLVSKAILILYKCMQSDALTQYFEYRLINAECIAAPDNLSVNIKSQNWEISGRFLL